jgi:hypothetical protein
VTVTLGLERFEVKVMGKRLRAVELEVEDILPWKRRVK